jgi:hypothetical protein
MGRELTKGREEEECAYQLSLFSITTFGELFAFPLLFCSIAFLLWALSLALLSVPLQGNHLQAFPKEVKGGRQREE